MNIQTLLYEATYTDEIKEITKEIYLLLTKENKKEGVVSIKEILNKNIKNINMIKNLQKIEDARVNYKFGVPNPTNPGTFYVHKDFPIIFLRYKDLASSALYDIISHEVTHLLDFIRRYPVDFELSIKQGKRYVKASDKAGSAKNFDRILNAHIKNGDMDNANKLYERMFKGTAPYFLSRVEFNEHITEFVTKYNQASGKIRMGMTNSFEDVLYYMGLPYTKEFINDKQLRKRIYKRLSRENIKFKETDNDN